MAKLIDTDAAIERIIKDKRHHMVTAERAELEKKRDHIIALNDDLRREDRKPVPDVDHEMGVFETSLDRKLEMLEKLAKKNCKVFREDAAKHGEALDFETLTAQSVEAAMYAPTIYFSIILGRSKEAVL